MLDIAGSNVAAGGAVTVGKTASDPVSATR
jgi:hypothetical protein